MEEQLVTTMRPNVNPQRRGATHRCANPRCGYVLGIEELNQHGVTIGIYLHADDEYLWQEFRKATQVACWRCETRRWLRPSRTKPQQ